MVWWCWCSNSGAELSKGSCVLRALPAFCDTPKEEAGRQGGKHLGRPSPPEFREGEPPRDLPLRCRGNDVRPPQGVGVGGT